MTRNKLGLFAITATLVSSGALASCQSTQTSVNCDELRDTAVHQSRPDSVRNLYPNAIYVGSGSAAASKVRENRTGCQLVARVSGGILTSR
ncbi:MAG: hypothetical protein AAGG69_07385 [Pseudomonadota bacterium]